MFKGQVTPRQSSHNPGGDLDLYRPPLFLTRPKAASVRFAAQFRLRVSADWPVVISPRMETVWLAPSVEISGVDGVVFTSESAVRGFVRLSANRELRAYCVGPRTAKVATAFGFSVIAGPGNALGLSRIIIAEGGSRRLLYPHGSHVAQDMGDLLKSAGIETVFVIVYDQVPIAMTQEAKQLMAQNTPILLPVFSVRSLQLLAEVMPPDRPGLYIAAISPAVAQVAAAMRPQHLVTAARPDGEAMLNALEQLAHYRSAG